MIKNYFLIALRNLKKYKIYATINILGLAVGITACSLIYLYVQDELSFDRFHRQADRIARASMTWKFDETELPSAAATTIVGPLLERALPEVLTHTRLYNSGLTLVKTEDEPFEERGFLYADSTFFEIFSFDLIQGNPQQALTQPRSIVFTREMAEKYYGDNWTEVGIINKIVRINDQEDYQITGVVENTPTNSQIQFNFLASFSSLRVAKQPNWDNSAYYTYLLLQEGTDIKTLDHKMPQLLENEFGENDPVALHIDPLTSVYLHSSTSSSIGPNSDIKYIYLFGAIGFFILLIACINYMNLATARSIERAKEVGLRKVFGAIRSQLMGQFLGESILLTFLALVLAVLLILGTLPAFNSLTGKHLFFNPINHPSLIIVLVMVGIGVSLLAGSYPAIALSGFKPVTVLRGKFRNSGSGNFIRKGLVVFQFCISIILLVGTVIVYRQLNYIQDKKLGYEQEHIVSLALDNQLKPKIEEIRNALSEVTGVLSSGGVSQTPGSVRWESTFSKPGQPERSLMVTLKGDDGLISTLGLELIAGNNLSGIHQQTEEYQYLINEKAAKFWGWEKEEAIGKNLTIWNSQMGTVKGVLKDFNFASLHDEVKPLIVFVNKSSSFNNRLLVKIDGKRVKETLAAIESVWKERAGHRPFSYNFLDEQFGMIYESEQKLSQILTVFTVLAIFIACMGLFGLASFTAVLKAKEIGIRKVLGASVAHIVLLFSNSYTQLILIAIAIATPITYWAMSQWLSNFAYRIDMDIWPFIGAGFTALLIAWLTVAYQSIKAAIADPIESLREE